MSYFDQAATSLLKPPAVAAAVAQAIETFGNPSRGAYAASLTANRAVYEARVLLARLFNCPRPEQVAFAANATMAINTALKGIVSAGDHVVTTALEHNSVLRPLLGGIVIAAIAFLPAASPYLGLGSAVIADAFTQPLPWYTFLGKLLFTSASLGVGFKGGEVTPLFYIGATLGNALAPILHLPMPMLAALGFAAVFAAATNTPIAGTLLAMELFGSGLGIYALLACVVAYMFSGMSGIYRAQRIAQHKHWFVPEGVKLGDVPQWVEQQKQDAKCYKPSKDSAMADKKT